MVVVVEINCTCLSICLSLSLKTQQFCELSSIFELDNIQNEAILQDFLNVWSWQHKKQSNSARLPSKMASYQCVLRFSSPCLQSNYCACHEKVRPGHTKCCACHAKSSCSKMQPISGNLRPDLLISLMNMSLVLRLPCEMHLFRSSSNAPRLPLFWTCYKTFTLCSLLTRCTIPCTCHAERHLNVQKCSVPVPVSFLHFWLWNVLRATTACTFSTSQLPKVVRAWRALMCFVHFDLEMCFAPQRRALFRRRNF